MTERASGKICRLRRFRCKDVETKVIAGRLPETASIHRFEPFAVETFAVRKLLVVLLLGASRSSLLAAEPDVVVPHHEDIDFLHAALERIGVPFQSAEKIDPAMLGRRRIVVVAGKNVSFDERDVRHLDAHWNAGGRVLAIGGGAKAMLDAKLFDATGYYPTGTTTFMSKFDGYHRLTFGYPIRAPKENWLYGIPNLLRATNGPLMRLGPQAHSVLAAGGPFSLMAYQRRGEGIALLIGPDPQGGDEYQSFDKPTPKRGDELDTDRLLANAIAWLREPTGNLVPNPGFETFSDAGPERSHWELIASNGGRAVWSRNGAAEGEVYAALSRGKSQSAANLTPHLPIAVEPGATYRFTCRYRATCPGRLVVRRIRSLEDPYPRAETQSLTIDASDAWDRYETELTVPAGIRYLGFVLQPAQIGELSVDDVQLQLREP